jgi:hypothetical protein
MHVAASKAKSAEMDNGRAKVRSGREGICIFLRSEVSGSVDSDNFGKFAFRRMAIGVIEKPIPLGLRRFQSITVAGLR